MAEELAYVLITPYSLLKSRTGGIIGRLMSMADLTLVGARMFAPSDKLIDKYLETIAEQELDLHLKKAFVDYLNDYLRPKNKLGIVNRTMLLLLRGENAVEIVKEQVVGPIMHTPRGDTIRGTYGDYITIPSGDVHYFEPAVFIGTSREMVKRHLRLFAEHGKTDGGILERLMPFESDAKPQTTLVILKPDNFAKQSSRPGNIIDMFSRAGLYIVGAKVLHMSVAEAERFYGPLRSIFVEKLKKDVVERVKEALDDTFGFEIQEEQYQAIGNILTDKNAEFEFNKIIEYMTGVNPKGMGEEAKQQPGRETCLALLYQGVGAVDKIRTTLGATNPAAAMPGTVRSIYANDLMRNAAHASDSPENALREREIIDMLEHERRCSICEVIAEHLGAEVAG